MLHGDDGDAGIHAQHETNGDDHHVNNRDIFQPARINEHQQEISAANDAKFEVEIKRAWEDDQRQHNRHADGGFATQHTRSDGAMLLFGVGAVGFDVHQVVDGVNQPGKQAKKNKRERNTQQSLPVAQLPIKDDTGVNDQIFEPLSGPHGFNHVLKHAFILSCFGIGRGKNSVR